jgi:hypothetical protein
MVFFAFLFQNTAQASEITADKIIELVNQSRSKDELPPLFLNEKLGEAALAKASDMIEHDYFSHTSPQGISPWFWISKQNYDYETAGENLAMNFIDVENQHDAWMKSPTHEKNILNPKYQEIGVAVKRGKLNGHTTVVAVQMFGSRADFVVPENKGEKVLAPLMTIKSGGDVLGSSSLKGPEEDGVREGMLAVLASILIVDFMAVLYIIFTKTTPIKDLAWIKNHGKA